ncbi:hypothetical protein CC86DRAFT_367083 [Ophiobolus disseminans]|uniref:Uncharacterized protein n=1 Tax=Ophiobolus disseminans TaxID=1469910 RepID=A0A6A7AF16_9PLEO|nr:hypothetical protein CC86DRAFT_367083 [Ophiobolus disseminans]
MYKVERDLPYQLMAIRGWEDEGLYSDRIAEPRKFLRFWTQSSIHVSLGWLCFGMYTIGLETLYNLYVRPRRQWIATKQANPRQRTSEEQLLKSTPKVVDYESAFT